MPEFATLERETLGVTVYKQIRSAILDGDFQPGEKLRIRQIADQMSVSGTPVRDALLQLVMERALEMPGPREIRIPKVSSEEFDEIQTLRIVLEGLAAETAAVRATPKDIRQLEKLNDRIGESFKGSDLKASLCLNRAFHAELYGLAKMPALADILDRLWLRMAPEIASWSEHALEKDFVEQHYMVIAALKDGDGTRAREAITKDIISGGEKISKFRQLSPEL